MSLVYAGTFRLGRPWVFEDVSFALWRMPENSIIDRREVQVLGDPSDPCWYPFQAFM